MAVTYWIQNERDVNVDIVKSVIKCRIEMNVCDDNLVHVVLIESF